MSRLYLISSKKHPDYCSCSFELVFFLEVWYLPEKKILFGKNKTLKTLYFDEKC